MPRHDTLSSPCTMVQENVVTCCVARVLGRQARHDKRDTRDMQQRTQHKRKCGAQSLAATSSAYGLLQTIRFLFWLVRHV